MQALYSFDHPTPLPNLYFQFFLWAYFIFIIKLTITLLTFFFAFFGLAHDFAFSHVYKQQACSTIFCALSNVINEVKKQNKNKMYN